MSNSTPKTLGRRSSSTKTRAASKAAETHETNATETKSSAPAVLAVFSQKFFDACQAKVSELVPTGSKAGIDPETKKDLRGKGVTPLMLLTSVGKEFNFPQPVPSKREVDGEMEDYLKITAEVDEGVKVFGYLLREGALGVVPRTAPLGGYGYEADRDSWARWPLTEREYGARAKRSRLFPIAWVVDARRAIEKAIPVPARFTKGDKGVSTPIGQDGRELSKYVTLRQVAQLMYETAVSRLVEDSPDGKVSAEDMKSAGLIYLGSNVEADIKLAVRDGLLGRLDFDGSKIFWLSEAEAAKVEANRRDTNVYHKEENPSGNREAGNQPDFMFLDIDLEHIDEDIEAFRGMLPNDGYDKNGDDVLTIEKFMQMSEAEEGEGETETPASVQGKSAQPTIAPPAPPSTPSSPAQTTVTPARTRRLGRSAA